MGTARTGKKNDQNTNGVRTAIHWDHNFLFSQQVILIFIVHNKVVCRPIDRRECDKPRVSLFREVARRRAEMNKEEDDEDERNKRRTNKEEGLLNRQEGTIDLEIVINFITTYSLPTVIYDTNTKTSNA